MNQIAPRARRATSRPSQLPRREDRLGTLPRAACLTTEPDRRAGVRVGFSSLGGFTRRRGRCSARTGSRGLCSARAGSRGGAEARRTALGAEIHAPQPTKRIWGRRWRGAVRGCVLLDPEGSSPRSPHLRVKCSFTAPRFGRATPVSQPGATLCVKMLPVMQKQHDASAASFP